MLFCRRLDLALVLPAVLLGLGGCGEGAPPPQSAAAVAVPAAPANPEPKAAQADCMLKSDAAACTTAAAHHDKLGDEQAAAHDLRSANEAFTRSCLYGSPHGCEAVGDAFKTSGSGPLATRNADLFFLRACGLGSAPACSKLSTGAAPPPDPELAALKEELSFFTSNASTLGELKGAAVDGAPDKIFECRRPLTGFTTLIRQNGDRSYSLIARSSRVAPAAPAFDLAVAKLETNRSVVVLDSDTAASLKGRLGGPKKVKRIVVKTYANHILKSMNGTTVLFIQSEDAGAPYEIELSHSR